METENRSLERQWASCDQVFIKNPLTRNETGVLVVTSVIHLMQCCYCCVIHR